MLLLIVEDTEDVAEAIAASPMSLTRREFSLPEAPRANRTRIMPKERRFSMKEEVGLDAIETCVARLRRGLEGKGVRSTRCAASAISWC